MQDVCTHCGWLVLAAAVSDRRNDPLLAPIIAAQTVLAAALAFVDIEGRPFSRDEVVTADVTRRSVGGILDVLANHDANTGLYYLLLHVWQKGGESEAWLRVPSALLVIATVPVVAVLSYRLLGFRVAAISGFVFAANPFVIHHADLARTYALSLFLMTVSMLLFVAVVRNATRLLLVAYVATTVVALLANPFSGLVLLAQFASVVGTSVDRAARRRALLGLLIACVAVLPLAVFLLMGSRDQVSWIGGVGLDTFVELASDVAGRRLLVPVMALAVVVGLACIGGVAAPDAARRLAKSERVLLVGWLVIPPLVLWLVSVAWPLFGSSYLIAVVPAYVIIASVGIVALARRWAIIVPVALAVVAGSIVASVKPDPPYEDYRAAARLVYEGARRGDAIGFSPAWARTGILVYFRQFDGEASERVPVDVALAPDGDAERVGDIFAREVGPKELVRRLEGYPRLWIVGYSSSGWHPTPEPMERVEKDFVERGYERTLVRTFGRLQVKLYERPEPAR